MPTFAERLRNMFHKIERNLTDKFDKPHQKYTNIINKYDLYEELPELGSYYEQFMNIPIDPETGVVTRPSDDDLKRILARCGYNNSTSKFYISQDEPNLVPDDMDELSRNEYIETLVLVIHIVLCMYSADVHNSWDDTLALCHDVLYVAALEYKKGFNADKPQRVLDYASNARCTRNVFRMNVLAILINDACLSNAFNRDYQSIP